MKLRKVPPPPGPPCMVRSSLFYMASSPQEGRYQRGRSLRPLDAPSLRKRNLLSLLHSAFPNAQRDEQRH